MASSLFSNLFDPSVACLANQYTAQMETSPDLVRSRCQVLLSLFGYQLSTARLNAFIIYGRLNMRIECCSGGPASLHDLLRRLGLSAVGLGRGHLGLLLLLLNHLDDALTTLDLKYQWLLLHRVVHLLLRLLPYQLLAQHYKVRFR